MTAVFLDTSAVLRVVLAQPDTLPDWGLWDAAFASRLLPVEISRTLWNYRVRQVYDDEDIAGLQAMVAEVTDNITLVGLSRAALERAGQPFASVVGTLDAIHIATALLLKEAEEPDIVFATHDRQQARSARAMGLTSSATSDRRLASWARPA